MEGLLRIWFEEVTWRGIKEMELGLVFAFLLLCWVSMDEV